MKKGQAKHSVIEARPHPTSQLTLLFFLSLYDRGKLWTNFPCHAPKLQEFAHLYLFRIDERSHIGQCINKICGQSLGMLNIGIEVWKGNSYETEVSMNKPNVIITPWFLTQWLLKQENREQAEIEWVESCLNLLTDRYEMTSNNLWRQSTMVSYSCSTLINDVI